MPFVKGQPRIAGRKKGTPNKSTQTVKEMLERLKCDPFEGMAMIASGDVPCGTCHGAGKTRYRIPNSEKVGERLCESCYGTLKERVSPALRGQMYSDLAKYVAPQLRAIEHQGPQGGPIHHVHRIHFE